MPRAMKASEMGLESHWKVRICGPGWVIHSASWTEPEYHGTGLPVDAKWVQDSSYGDVLGYVSWAEVIALSWRWSELWRKSL